MTRDTLDKQFNSIYLSLTSFLDCVYNEISTPCRIYCIVNDIFSLDRMPRCPMCGNPRSIKKGPEPRPTCGRMQCVNSSPELVAKRQASTLAKYGTYSNAYHNAKKDTTMTERYGVTNPSQSKKLIEHKEANNIKKYGERYSWMREDRKKEIKAALVDKHGVDNISHLQEIKDKKEQLSNMKYGVRNVSQSPEVRQKILESSGIEYTLSNGQRVLLDSELEVKACEYLLHIDYSIITQPLLTGDEQIWYTGTDGKTHTWFPDIQIVETGVLVEVKAVDTISLYREDRSRNNMNLWGIMNSNNAQLILVNSYNSNIYHLEKLQILNTWRDIKGNIEEIENILNTNNIFIAE